MPRSRNIKPSFFKNEDLADVDPIGRLLFVGLWTLSDRSGLVEYRPKRIKAELFPYDHDLDVNRYLTVLDQLGFIQILTDGVNEWIFIKNFSKHQNPHHTEKTQHPDPKSLRLKGSDSVTGTTPLSNGYNPADSLLLIPDSLIPDSNEKQAPAKANASKKSKSFKPPTVEEVKEYCKQRRNNISPEKFIDHYEARGWMLGKNKMKSWQAAVRTWEGNDYNQTAKQDPIPEDCPIPKNPAMLQPWAKENGYPPPGAMDMGVYRDFLIRKWRERK